MIFFYKSYISRKNTLSYIYKQGSFIKKRSSLGDVLLFFVSDACQACTQHVSAHSKRSQHTWSRCLVADNNGSKQTSSSTSKISVVAKSNSQNMVATRGSFAGNTSKIRGNWSTHSNFNHGCMVFQPVQDITKHIKRMNIDFTTMMPGLEHM